MNRRDFLKGSIAAGVATLLPGLSDALAGDEDIVLAGGRVIDPESGLDAVRNVGIRGSRVSAVATRRLKGRTTIDASGLVVAPGFIDPIAHGLDLENNRLQALDGVTTTLQLESGYDDVAGFYKECEGTR